MTSQHTDSSLLRECEHTGSDSKEQTTLLQPRQTCRISDLQVTVDRLLGKGKGGYSYLVHDEDGHCYVLKQIHHEPCSYYHFTDKLQSEIRDYTRLTALDLPLPKLLAVDYEQERILKEYIDGPTIAELTAVHQLEPDHLLQMQAMLDKLYPAGINIDYYPTNFVVNAQGKIFYIDYECNEYHDEWNYENWGSAFWKNGTVL